MIPSKALIDIFVAISSLFSMVMNVIKSFKPNVSGALLLSLAMQQLGNMLVALNLTATKLNQQQQQWYIGASVLALGLTYLQFIVMFYKKISGRLRLGV